MPCKIFKRINWPRGPIIMFQIILLLLFSLLIAPPGIAGSVFHPLDPLTRAEILESAALVRASNPSLFNSGNSWAFSWITLREPEKSLLLNFFLNDQDPPPQIPNLLLIPRKSLIVLLQRETGIVNEVVVNLGARRVESWTRVPDGAKVAFSNEDDNNGPAIAVADPAVQKRCRELGWANLSLVIGEVWGVGYGGDRPVLRDAIRPIQVYPYGQLFDGENHFAHPFDFVVTVDLATQKVIAIDDLPTHTDYNAANRNGNVCPRLRADYNPALLPPTFYRRDIHPIRFTQPRGASYQIRGQEVTWQKFKLRVGFNGREGLVIHHVSYKDGLVTRPLFYRLSVGEVFVPYGDARPPFHQKYAFDMSEFTFGNSAVDLKSAGLCRGGGVVAYMDFSTHDESGTPVSLPAAVCIYEEDAGLLWAHWSSDSHRTFHTRSQRLVITCFSNLGNYDYQLSWRFYQDGNIDFHVELHGLIASQMLAKGVGDAGEFGNIVAPQIDGQFHQHFFALRIDPEIDGDGGNSVSTLDVVPLPDPTGSPRNPYGQGFTTLDQLLQTQAEARTNISPSTGRSWLIRNPNRINSINKRAVSWRLVPYNSPSHFVRQDSPMHPRAAWADYSVWVVKYKDYQLYPAGFYQNYNEGLVAWVNSDPDANITNTDLVLWYIFGITHLPRTEDWPVMNVESATIVLKPTNFFSENPALDVPPPPPF